MNVLLISQCSKQALKITRRILDHFAERKGERTWQTAITMQGLETLRMMLRKRARRNTSVACHWIRGHKYSELLWIVGDAGQFNEQGLIPTNITGRDVLRTKDENTWKTLEDISLITSLAALFHDFGKASEAFQNKLKNPQFIADPLRHEWISVRLLQAIVGGEQDSIWLKRLGLLTDGDETDLLIQSVLNELQKDGVTAKRLSSPFKNMETSPLAQLVAWLILSHHRLPVLSASTKELNINRLNYLPGTISHVWNGSRLDSSDVDVEEYWCFPVGLPMVSFQWRQRAQRVVERMLNRPSLLELTSCWKNPFMMHVSRLALMLADHYFSSLPSRYQKSCNSEIAELYANTDRKSHLLNQHLDEHLIGVEKSARGLLRVLPGLFFKLPRITRHKGFKRRSSDRRFRWQDKAYDLTVSLREKSSLQGFFGVNMASTGTGKTLANGRIMYGLAKPEFGARFSIALGLRVLTLQTGEAYQRRLGLGSDDLAVLVGERAVRDLYERESQYAQPVFGSESSGELMPDNTYVRFDGAIEGGPLHQWLQNNPQLQALVNAPILVSTIDHLIPAAESLRGGHQIAPELRLLTSDLVLDEPDDFGLGDLPALTRLVHKAGLLGSRVLLSSATLPPDLVQGLFRAYWYGRNMFRQNCREDDIEEKVCCAWFDEHTAITKDHADADEFMETHSNFVDKRLKKLNTAQVRRLASIREIESSEEDADKIHKEFALQLLPLIYQLHDEQHVVDTSTGKFVSFGLIRMANIDPLYDVAKALLSQGSNEPYFIHLCPYHSHHPLIVRSSLEAVLDRVLDRKEPDRVFSLPEVRGWLSSNNERHQIFIVLATPVEEVGRDHDYDWAIVEPSSMRSIIQLAGRVKRHRDEPCSTPNIYLLNQNIKALKGQRVVFCRPGFEDSNHLLSSHKLTDVLREEDIARIDATPRIRKRDELKSDENLVDLEHYRFKELMTGDENGLENPVTLWWETPAQLTGELQKNQPFRWDYRKYERFVLMPDEELISFDFKRVEEDNSLTCQNNLFQREDFVFSRRIGVFGVPEYLDALQRISDELAIDTVESAWKFGFVDLPELNDEQHWIYHPYLGMRRGLHN